MADNSKPATNGDPRVNDPAPAAPAAPAEPTTPAEPTAPQEPVKPAETKPEKVSKEAKTDKPKMKTIHLQYEFTTNMPEGLIHYGPGEVTVDEATADDLLRRNAEHAAYRESVHVGEKAVLNAGTISGGGQ